MLPTWCPADGDTVRRKHVLTGIRPERRALRTSAPRETRTPTRDTPDKALNLARLPIPPQALVAGRSIDPGHVCATSLAAVRWPGYSANTCSIQRHLRQHQQEQPNGGEASPDGRSEADQAPA